MELSFLVHKLPLPVRVTLYNKNSRRGYLNKEAVTKSSLPPVDRANEAPIAKIFVVGDQKDAAFIGSCIRCQRGLSVILEPSLEKAFGRRATQIPDKIRKHST
jgi:hypothetical protein